jgi:hypothetical protein
MNYSDIQAQFLSLLNRRDCTTAQAQGFIQMAMQRIQRDAIRIPAMEKSLIVTIQPGYTGLVIPSDLLELINLIPTSTNGGTGQSDFKRMEKCDITTALNMGIHVGVPRRYSRQGGVWILGAAPAIGDTIRIDYYAELAALVSPTDTNAITLIAPDLLIYGALCYAGDFYTDKRMANWEERFQQISTDLQNQANDDEDGGAAAVQGAFYYPDELNDGWDIYPYDGVF